jgi:hypothetical protein
VITIDTRKIITGLRNGKTTELIKISNKTWQYIICKDWNRVHVIVKMAEELELTIPYPITIRELPLKSKYINEVLVDDALDILQVFIGKNISYATTRAQHMELKEIESIRRHR